MKLFSIRSFIVYSNFLAIPIVLTLLWLLLPIASYFQYSAVSMTYYIVMFFTWISFYDLNLPGCSKIQIIIFFIIYIGIAIGWLSVVTEIDKESNRLAYSFVDAVVILLCALCYMLHVIVHKIKKIYVYSDDQHFVDQKGKRRSKRRSQAWTKNLSRFFCYYKRIDIDDADHFKQVSLAMSSPDDTIRDGVDKNKNPSLKQVLFVQKLVSNRDSGGKTLEEIEAGGSAIELSTIKRQDSKPSLNSSSEFKTGFKRDEEGNISNTTRTVQKVEVTSQEYIELMPKYEISYRNFFCTVLYQFFVVLSWFWLHNFSILIRDKDLFRTPALALLSIVIFQVSRVILMGISGALNRLLKPKEIQFFTYFQFPLMFFLYYRNLFLNTSSWAVTVLVSLVLFLIDVIYYPLQMTKKYWEFRNIHLLNFLDKRSSMWIFRLLRKILDDANPSYDRHVMRLSIEYYYDKMAEYISIITTVAFISLIRSLEYKVRFYPTFDALSHDQFVQLLYRYLYLFFFEIFYDLAVRYASRKFLKIDISNRGRNETVANYCTRFIFTLFLLYDLMDVYNIQVVFREPEYFNSSSASSFSSSSII
ncbi:hypothetical protein DLAC_04111 [Tieghemostelium lacteum]|uniref:Transmembrane protein n=1 Tax=Tieghemostelium lacteum TaxID=361077 RepID=A0A151ZS94_TIELA|nr:hypothetical protein DLAC_04111 [Tieghemostelium lacteum]|eukprot:KYQ96808.1 hypothetical protein DLAC_04111 [Tieghemostelium lacteum]